MAVGSMYEMFLTSFGWMLYGVIWDVLVATGLAYLPFLAVIVDNVVKPLESQEAKTAAVTSLRRTEIDVIRLIIVLMLAVSPSMTLNYGTPSYTSACKGETYNPGNSSAVLDEVLSPSLLGGREVQVPPWFYIVMSVSGGINDAIISAIPCELDVRQTLREVNLQTISDDLLRVDLVRFTQECYYPSVAWMRNKRQSPEDADLMEDAAWIGSQYFLRTNYRQIDAKSPVPGFSYDRTRRADRSYSLEDTPTNLLPENGYPSCYDWWMDDKNGLRARLVDEFPPSLYQRVNRLLQPEQLRREQDAVLAKVLHDDVNLKIASTLQGTGSKSDGLGEYVSGVVAGFGGMIASTLLQPLVFGVKMAAPIIQSMLLMAVYFMLPLILLIGKFETKTVMQSTVFIIAVKFWTVIWAVLDVLDNKFFGVIKAASGTRGLFSLTNELIMIKAIFDLAILTFYIAGPLLFMSLLSWAGHDRASAGNSVASDGVGAGTKAGEQGVSAAKSALPKK